MDAFTQQRVLELRQEIALLQRDNESYRVQRRTASLSQYSRRTVWAGALLTHKTRILKASSRWRGLEGTYLAT